jgi:hypothetical protein
MRYRRRPGERWDPVVVKKVNTTLGPDFRQDDDDAGLIIKKERFLIN